MISDLQKYRAQVFQISGFALMAPVGKFVLDLKDTKPGDMDIWYFICLVIAFMLGYFGIIFIFKGEEKLEELRKKHYE